MTFWPFLRMRWPLALSCLALGCVVEKQVLQAPPEADGGDGGSGPLGGASAGGGGRPMPPTGGGGTAGVPAPGGAGSTAMMPVIWEDCLAALSGNDGDACQPEGGFPCEGKEPCRVRYAACLPSMRNPEAEFELTLGEQDTCSEMCEVDEQCEPGSWCRENVCSPCQAPGPCAPTWEVVDRNGCPWCVPPSACRDPRECAEGVCFPGHVCPPGCRGDVQCCHGNVCVPDGCPPADELDCSVVGCRGDAACIVSEPAKCWCDPGASAWSCLPEEPVNFCK